MSEATVTTGQRLEKLQTLMHRMVFHSFLNSGNSARNPYRGQGRVLAVLEGEPEISQKELTQKLGMSKQSLAELLGKLEKSGMIRRTQSETDKRSVIVHLLPEGRKAARELVDVSCDVEYLFDCLNDAERQQFNAYLERILDRCADSFPGENAADRRSSMESFLAYHNYGFRRIDFNAAVAAEHQKRRQECKNQKEAQKGEE